jgi:hypothetical protein
LLDLFKQLGSRLKDIAQDYTNQEVSE